MRLKFSIAMICMLVVGATTSALAFLVKPTLDEIFLKRNAELLTWIPLAVVGIYLTKGACNYTQTVLMNFIGQRVVADLRASLYRKIQTPVARLLHKEPDGNTYVPDHERCILHPGGGLGGGHRPSQGLLHACLPRLRHLLPGLAARHHRHVRLPAGRLSHRQVRPEDAAGRDEDPGHLRKSDHPPPGDDLGNPDRQGVQHGRV